MDPINWSSLFFGENILCVTFEVSAFPQEMFAFHSGKKKKNTGNLKIFKNHPILSIQKYIAAFTEAVIKITYALRFVCEAS